MFPEKTNVGFYDKMARMLFGGGLIAVALAGGPNMYILGLIGLVPLLTGLTGRCPLYKMMGVDTSQQG
jgi:hypothetical protein